MKKIIILIVIFIFLGILFTYPLVKYFYKGIPYTRLPEKAYEVCGLKPGNNLQFYYHLWLLKDTVIDQKTPSFSNPYEFNVDGIKKGINLYYLPISLPFLFTCFFTHPLVAYNILIILSFIFSGLAMFFLSRFYLKEFWPSFISAIIYCIIPYRVGLTIGGNSTGFSFFLFPLFILFLEKIIAEKKSRYSIYAGLCVFAMSQNDQYMLFFSFLLIPFLFLFRWRVIFPGKNKVRKTLGEWVLILFPFIILSFLTVVYLLYVRKMTVNVSMMKKVHTFKELGLHSPVVSEALYMLQTDTTRNVYIGIIPFLLSISGVFSGIFSRSILNENKTLRATTLLYTVIFLFSFILCFGPNFPGSFYNICFKIIPFFNYISLPNMLFICTATGLAILSGIGTLQLWKYKKKIWLYCTIIGLIILDFHPLKPIGISIPPRKSALLASITENIDPLKETVLHIPFWPGDNSWSSIYLYVTTISGLPMVNGYNISAPLFYYNDIFVPLKVLNLGEIQYQEYELLKKLRVKYIILHEEAYPLNISPFPFQFALNNFRMSKYLEFIDYEYPLWLFKVRETIKPGKDLFLPSSKTGMLYEAERLPRLTGRVIEDSDASGNQSVKVSEGIDKKGFMSFGPYSYNPTGTYVVTFRVKTDNPDITEPVANFEITADKGKKYIKEMHITGNELNGKEYQDIIMEFSIEQPSEIEYRIDYFGKGSLLFDYIYVLMKDQKDPLYDYNAEDLFHTGRIVSDIDADGNEAIHLIAGFDPVDFAMYGPYRRFPPGDYTLSWRVKYAQEGKAGSVAIFQITSDLGKTVLAKKEISFNQQNINDKGYELVEQKIHLVYPTVLEFIMFFNGNRDVWVDKIKVVKENADGELM